MYKLQLIQKFVLHFTVLLYSFTKMTNNELNKNIFGYAFLICWKTTILIFLLQSLRGKYHGTWIPLPSSTDQPKPTPHFRSQPTPLASCLFWKTRWMGEGAVTRKILSCSSLLTLKSAACINWHSLSNFEARRSSVNVFIVGEKSNLMQFDVHSVINAVIMLFVLL